MNVLETNGLGRRYRDRWALRDCTLTVPGGRIVGLVGPNGAGKTTLLHLCAGLLLPSVGRIRVLGGDPPRENRETLARIGFVAQDKALYPRFRVEEMVRFGAWLNPAWDDAVAREHLRRLGISLDQRVGELSGGQRAQVALAIALGKRPELLLLDEPVANLDPLARRDFLSVVMAEAAQRELTVVLSSHLVADLERVCDYLILLARSRTQLSGDIDELLATHLMAVGARARVSSLPSSHTVIDASYTDRQATLVLRGPGPLADPAWTTRRLTLEELVLTYMAQPDAVRSPPQLSCAREVVQA